MSWNRTNQSQNISSAAESRGYWIFHVETQFTGDVQTKAVWLHFWRISRIEDTLFFFFPIAAYKNCHLKEGQTEKSMVIKNTQVSKSLNEIHIRAELDASREFCDWACSKTTLYITVCLDIPTINAWKKHIKTEAGILVIVHLQSRNNIARTVEMVHTREQKNSNLLPCRRAGTKNQEAGGPKP